MLALMMLQLQVQQKRNLASFEADRVQTCAENYSLRAMLFVFAGMEQVYSKEHTFSHLADVK